MSAGIMVTGEDNIRFAGGLTIASGLAIELRTGMKMSRHGSGIQAAQLHGFIPEGRTTKKKALAGVVAALKELRPDYVPNSTVQGALDGK